MENGKYSRPRLLNRGEYSPDEKIRKLTLEGELGLLKLPLQVVKQRITDGFAFNILCIGETGIGKSSLISSLFDIDLGMEVPLSHQNPTVELESRTYSVDEDGVGLLVTVTETIGYGDQICMKDSYEPIVNFINSQMEKYLLEEMRVHRSFSLFQDSRIHACLFFICPTGHGLKALDIVCLKSIHRKVNVIPIVAKADTLSRVELARFKENVMRELLKEGIEIYDCDVDEEAIFEADYSLPLAVVGSRDFVVLDGRMVRGRRYPWGTVVVEDEDHSEFCVLKEKLVHTNTIDLMDRTHVVHYERYRREQLRQFSDSEVVDLLKMESRREMELLREKNRLEEEKAIRSFLKKAKQKLGELMDEEELMKGKFRELFLAAELEEKKLKEQRRMLEKDILKLQKLKDQLRETKSESNYNPIGILKRD